MELWLEMGGTERNAPAIVEVDPSQISHAGMFSEGTAAAIYECGFRAISVRRGSNWDLPASETILVHELTHHKQCLAGMIGTLPTQRSRVEWCRIETEAYEAAAQHIWMKARAGRLGAPGTLTYNEQMRHAEHIGKWSAEIVAKHRRDGGC
jgi:hypothetical protein